MTPHTNNMMQIIATITNSFYFASIVEEGKNRKQAKQKMHIENGGQRKV